VCPSIVVASSLPKCILEKLEKQLTHNINGYQPTREANSFSSVGLLWFFPWVLLVTIPNPGKLAAQGSSAWVVHKHPSANTLVICTIAVCHRLCMCVHACMFESYCDNKNTAYILNKFYVCILLPQICNIS